MTHNHTNSIAVFTRNYEEHLAEAVKRYQADPNSQVLFRSARQWTSASRAIDTNGPIPIYFLPVDSSDGLITYVAQLVRVEVEPERLTEDEVRQHSVETTQDEGFWEEGGESTIKTFYFVSHCRKVSPLEQIHFTDLRKHSDGERIAENYGYSYVIVQPHPMLTV